MCSSDLNTIRHNRILQLAKQTTAATNGTLITASDAKALTSNYKDFTMENWGDSFGINEDVDVLSFVSDAQNQEVIAYQMARTLNYQVAKKLSTQGLRHRIDDDSTYQVSGTVDSATASTVVDATLTQADDFWNGGYITITNPDGPGYDETVPVTDFVNATATLSAAFTNVPTTASHYRLTVGTGVAATDKLTTTGLLTASIMHGLLRTERFSGMLYRAFIHPAQHNDLYNDTTFKNSAVYDNSGRFKSVRLGRWFDIEFLISGELYREDVDGTENEDGIVYVSPIIGAHAYAIYNYANPGGSGKFATKFYVVDKPDSQNLRASAKWISWKGMWAGGVLKSTSVIDLMTGATSLNILV